MGRENPGNAAMAWLSKAAEIDPQCVSPSPRHPVGKSFGDWVVLLGYDFETREEGALGAITLYWQVRKPPPVNYRISLRFDHPQSGSTDVSHNLLYGAVSWEETREGQILKESYLVRFPEELIRATCRLNVSLVGESEVYPPDGDQEPIGVIEVE
jgi:hypothetical protein